MVVAEKSLLSVKIRGQLAEMCTVEWLHGGKAVLAVTHGLVGLYSLKKQQHVLNIHANAQFILLAVQSMSTSAKVCWVIHHHKRKALEQCKV